MDSSTKQDCLAHDAPKARVVEGLHTVRKLAMKELEAASGGGQVARSGTYYTGSATVDPDD